MPYRRTESVEARLLDNRARILAAAREQVSEGGWDEAQIASIAAAAEMATGTVYRYFASKAALFAEVLSRVSQRELEVLSSIASTDAPPPERLHAAVATFVRRAMQKPRLAYALIAEPCEKAIDEERLRWRAEISRAIMALIGEGQRLGHFRSDLQPEIAATAIVGGFMEGLIGPLSPLTGRHPASIKARHAFIDDLSRQIADLCCAAVLIPSAGNVTALPRVKGNKP